MILTVSERVLLNRLYKFSFECSLVDICLSSEVDEVLDTDKYVLKFKSEYGGQPSKRVGWCPMCDNENILCVSCGNCFLCNHTKCIHCKTFIEIIFNRYYIKHENGEDKECYFYVLETDDEHNEGLHDFFKELHSKKQ